MSLREMLSGARKEAQEAGGLFVGRDDGAHEAEAGFSRRSAARARPARDAAGTVRVVSVEDARAGRTSGKHASEMTREERKAERAAQRDVEDRRTSATNILLQRQEEYRRAQRVWWVLLGVGFALTVASFVLSRVVRLTEETADLMIIVAIVVLVVSYGLIIAAFIYDWRRVRPLRKAAEAEVSRLTNKRVNAIILEDVQEQSAEAEAKAAHKGSRARLFSRRAGRARDE